MLGEKLSRLASAAGILAVALLLVGLVVIADEGESTSSNGDEVDRSLTAPVERGSPETTVPASNLPVGGDPVEMGGDAPGRSLDADGSGVADDLETAAGRAPADTVAVMVRASGDVDAVVGRIAGEVSSATAIRPIPGTDLLSLRLEGRQVAALAGIEGVGSVEGDYPVSRPLDDGGDAGASGGATPRSPAGSAIANPLASDVVGAGDGGVGPDEWRQSYDWAVTVTDADPALAAVATRYNLSGDRDGNPFRYTRDDVVIAVVDTGIDDTHLAFSGGKVLAHRDFVSDRDPSCGAGPETTGVWDESGHGTHVAAIAAGRDGVFTGVAPGAALIDLKVFDCRELGWLSDTAAALAWVLENQTEFGIDVVNLSLGAAVSSDGTDLTSQLVNQLTARGVQVTVAAGNSQMSGSIGIPASAKFATTVGAMTAGVVGEGRATFSSMGPTLDGRPGIDLMAPGVRIEAAYRAPGWEGRRRAALSGTSMAAPFVAGVYALLASASAELAPAGETCSPDPSTGACADGVTKVTMRNPGLDLLARTAEDWFEPGQDAVSGWGALRGATAIGEEFGALPVASAYPGARSLTTTLTNDHRISVSVDTSDAPASISLVGTDTGTFGASNYSVTALGEDGRAISLGSVPYADAFSIGAGQFLGWVPQGSGPTWLEIIPHVASPRPVSVTVTGSALGEFVHGVGLVATGGTTEGGTAGSVRVTVGRTLDEDLEFEVVTDGELTVGTSTVVLPAGTPEATVNLAVGAVDDARAEGFHSGVLSLRQLVDPGDPPGGLLRVSVPVTDNDAGVVAERRLMLPSGELPPGTILQDAPIMSAGGHVAYQLRGNLVARQFDLPLYSGDSYGVLAIADPGGPLEPVAVGANGRHISCQVDAYGLSSDGRYLIAAVYPVCASDVVPGAPFAYTFFVRDRLTGVNTRLAPPGGGFDNPEVTGDNWFRGGTSAVVDPQGGTFAVFGPATSVPGSPTVIHVWRRSTNQWSTISLPGLIDYRTRLQRISAAWLILGTWDRQFLPSGNSSGYLRIDLATGARSEVRNTTTGEPLYEPSFDPGLSSAAGTTSPPGSSLRFEDLATGIGGNLPSSWGRLQTTGLMTPGANQILLGASGRVGASEVPFAEARSVYALWDRTTGTFTPVVGEGSDEWLAGSPGSTRYAPILVPSGPQLFVRQRASGSGDGNGATDLIVRDRLLADVPSVEPPAAPTGVRASPTATGVSVSWQPVGGATGYEVMLHSSEGVPVMRYVGNVTTVSLDRADYAPAGPFTYVRATVDGLTGAGTRVSWSEVPPTPVITSLVATGASTSVTVSGWDTSLTSTSRWQSFTVEYRRPGGAWTAAGTVPATAGPSSLIAQSGDLPALGEWRGVVVLSRNFSGEAVEFRAAAGNPSGLGPWTAPTTVGFDLTTPSTPTRVRLVPGDGEVQVSWSPPVTSRGSAVTGYRVAVSPGDRGCETVADGDGNVATGCVVAGLAGGERYEVVVSAVNASGLGDPFVTSVQLPTVPGTPEELAAVPGDGVVRLSWLPPASDGGSPITGYRVTDPTGEYGCETDGGDGGTIPTECMVSGLDNGTEYSFAVVARNALGEGTASPWVQARPLAVPGPPVITEVVAGVRWVRLSWDPPLTLGGDEPTGYVVWNSVDGGTSWQEVDGDRREATSVTVWGLDPGQTYLFRVVAWNDAGGGEASEASSAVVPLNGVERPATPKVAAVVAGDGWLRVTFSPSAAGGPPTAYLVRVVSALSGATEGSCAVEGDLDFCTIEELSPSGMYRVVVLAENEAGPSAPSAPWPSAPQVVTPGSGSLELAFPDITGSPEFIRAASLLKMRGISTAPRFYPASPVTRSQMAVFLWRMGGRAEAPTSCSVSDIGAEGEQARQAVCWLLSRGITQVGSRYYPAGTVTRSQMALFMWRFAGEPGKDDPAFTGECGVRDVAGEGPATRKAICWLKDNGITAVSTNYYPNSVVDRRSMALFLGRLGATLGYWGSPGNVG